MANPVRYLKEVKQEALKVTWPSRQETITSTIAVLIMVVLASLFLYVSDQILAFLVSLILGIGV
ncbi:MAG TPA: preprotein translocase subunit SecE [Micavibrio sp.]|jgi:preprotein translocase subunit SecE|nr:preprotein translocase subunit SecE [Micavibrio sp.]